jgi:hypothetical protein
VERKREWERERERGRESEGGRKPEGERQGGQTVCRQGGQTDRLGRTALAD